MLKTYTDKQRHALNGEAMGTRWTALFYTEPGYDSLPLKQAIQSILDEVDDQMSTWKPDSDLNRLNASPADQWIELPDRLMHVLEAALGIGRATDGAFDIGVGDAVLAWGFGALDADPQKIGEARARQRKPAHSILQLDVKSGLACKREAATFDLNGIAKGYGVDCMAEIMREHGISSALLSIDGELVALGCQPDGSPWPVAVEAPVPGERSIHSVIELHNVAIATSGDYRHFVNVNGRDLAHTMDPRRGMPLLKSPASVSVMAKDCMTADAWATVYMVLGLDAGMETARKTGMSVLFLQRDGNAAGSGLFA